MTLYRSRAQFRPADVGAVHLSQQRDLLECTWPADIPACVALPTKHFTPGLYVSDSLAGEDLLGGVVLSLLTWAPAKVLVCTALQRAGYRVEEVEEALSVVSTTEARVTVLSAFLPGLRRFSARLYIGRDALVRALRELRG